MKTMNASEVSAWRVLIELGARCTQLGGKYALDMSDMRITSGRKMALFCSALVEVAGRSGCNRRHMDRNGNLVYVVTDDAEFARRFAPKESE